MRTQPPFQSTLPLRGATGYVSPWSPMGRHFNPRSPYGERPGKAGKVGKEAQFQSTLPLRGATICRAGGDRPAHNFNPRSPYGERQVFPGQKVINKEFQSTLPLRGATMKRASRRPKSCISIHAPLTGSDPSGFLLFRNFHISIHAPLTGSDHPSSRRCWNPGDFNPRSPYGERLSSFVFSFISSVFQSTLPLRGATCRGLDSTCTGTFQSTLPLRGATFFIGRNGTMEVFQSTLPLRGATGLPLLPRPVASISIHAPLTGSDVDFTVDIQLLGGFQSTLPLRGATRYSHPGRGSPPYFNPRSPYGERLAGQRHKFSNPDFNPRSPYGERQHLRGVTGGDLSFQSTLPLRGAT